MTLTAFLAEELARIAQQDREIDAAHARLARLATRAREGRPSGLSIRERISLAIRPTPATCQPC